MVVCAVPRGQREPGVFPDPRAQGQRARVRDKARQEAGRNHQEGALLVLSREGAHVPVFRTTSLQRQIRADAKEVGMFAAIGQGPVGYVGAVLLTFSIPPQVGAGYWLVLLGFMVMTVGTFLN